MLIEQELKNIPQKYWIMINYHDFVRNSTNYMKIISEWLNVAMSINHCLLVPSSLHRLHANSMRIIVFVQNFRFQKQKNQLNLPKYEQIR